jgi:hypothetical protein
MANVRGQKMSQQKLESAKNVFFIALGIDMAVTVLVLISDVWALGILNDIRLGASTVDQSTISTIEFWRSFATVAILTMIGVGLALVRWLGECYVYAKEALKATGFVQERWKIWGWIVPFMNLFKPYQVLSEIHKAGTADYVGGDDWKKSSGSGMLLVWWIFWVITHMIMWVIGKQTLKIAFRNDLTLDQVIGTYYGSVAACVISLIVAGLWFVVVGSLTRRLLSRSTAGVASVKPTYSTTSKDSSMVPEILQTKLPEVVQVMSSAQPTTNTNLFVVPEPSQQSIDEIEDRLYVQIAHEVETNTVDKGIWTKAYAQTDGDEKQTRVIYIKTRFERLMTAEKLRLDAIRHEQKETARRAEEERFLEAQELIRRKRILVHGKTPEEVENLAASSEGKEFLDQCCWGDMKYVTEQVRKNPLYLSMYTSEGNTALHYAVITKRMAMVKFLVNEGAKTQVRNGEGRTPLDIARASNQPEIVALLEAAS